MKAKMRLFVLYMQSYDIIIYTYYLVILLYVFSLPYKYMSYLFYSDFESFSV